jgi:8-oxo-dGTP pyrophosphatase MutT (NUDIX family)
MTTDPIKDLLDKVPCQKDLAGHLALPSVAALIVSAAGNVLVSKRCGEYRPDYWQFPGGMIRHSESLVDAARRETKEEVGREDLRYAGICHVDDGVIEGVHWVCVFLVFHVESEALPPNPEPDKNCGWDWVSPDVVTKRKVAPLMPGMVPAVKGYLNVERIDR